MLISIEAEKWVGKTYSEVGGCFGLVDKICIDVWNVDLIVLMNQQRLMPFAEDLELEPGDLLTVGRNPGHIGMAISDTDIIHACVRQGVIVENIRGWKNANRWRVSNVGQ